MVAPVESGGLSKTPRFCDSVSMIVCSHLTSVAQGRERRGCRSIQAKRRIPQESEREHEIYDMSLIRWHAFYRLVDVRDDTSGHRTVDTVDGSNAFFLSLSKTYTVA